MRTLKFTVANPELCETCEDRFKCLTNKDTEIECIIDDGKKVILPYKPCLDFINWDDCRNGFDAKTSPKFASVKVKIMKVVIVELNE
jgi:hypothetical protein